MSRRFITANRAQSSLLPPSRDDWVEEGHLVRFLHDCIEQFDLSEFTSSYSREGGSPYDPKMMLTLLLYAWCLGIRSSRKIAAACHERIDFRWAAGNIRPDHCAFARFFQRHGEAIKDLFTQVLCLCGRVGAIRLGVVSLDGTKVGANASLSANRTLSRLRAEIERMEAEMLRQDAADEARCGAGGDGEDLPEELRRQRDRLARLRAAKESLELDWAAERVLSASSSSGESGEGRGSGTGASSPCPAQGELPFGAGQSSAAPGPSSVPAQQPGSAVGVGDAVEQPAALAGARTEQPAALSVPEAAVGERGAASAAAATQGDEAGSAETKAPRQSGQKSKKSGKKKEARVNVTDPESRIMKGRSGLVQAYNAQAVVTPEQFVVACEVVQDENDLHQLQPMLSKLKRLLAAAGIEALPKRLAADAGYWLKDLNIEELEQAGPELFIATCNPRNQPKETPRGRLPQSATATERMTRKLSTQTGRKTYQQRGKTVEPVFGQIKECLNARRFLRRGLEKARQEWSLLCSCLNLRKLSVWLGKKKGGKGLGTVLAAG